VVAAVAEAISDILNVYREISMSVLGGHSTLGSTLYGGNRL
jgi:hypothetical protein